jgi:hypothetical protein
MTARRRGARRPPGWPRAGSVFSVRAAWGPWRRCPRGPRAPHDLQLLRDARKARPVYIRAALLLRGHVPVPCGMPGCRSVRYRPRHEPGGVAPLGHGSPVLPVEPGDRPVSRTCSTRVMEVLPPCLAVLSHLMRARRGCQVPPAAGLLLRGRCDSVTRQEEARQLLARLSELARDDTLSEEDATEMVAGLVGALERMRENPAWQRVMAKAGPRLSRWPRWITAWSSPPHDPDTPRPEMPLTHAPARQHRRLKRPEPGQSSTGSATICSRLSSTSRSLRRPMCSVRPRLAPSV